MRQMGPTVHEKDRRKSIAALESKPAEGFGRRASISVKESVDQNDPAFVEARRSRIRASIRERREN